MCNQIQLKFQIQYSEGQQRKYGLNYGIYLFI